MAIFLTQNGEPEQFGLAYNDNAYVIKTTNYTPTMRFRISVLPITYPTDPAIATVRVYPTRGVSGSTVYTDRAFFDPSRFLQSYINGQVDIFGANHNGFYVANQIHKEYFLAIQEEDKDAQGVYQPGDLFVTNIKSVWNGGLVLTNWLGFDYNDYLINTYSTTKKFLTASPRVQKINTGQSHHLYFIANDRFAADHYTIKAYSGLNLSGSLLATAEVDNNISVANSWAETYFRIPVGTYDIGNIDPTLMTGSTPSTVLSGAASYSIQLKDNTNAEVSEKFTFNVDSVCSKYEPVRLHWLNRLGGYDSFNFNAKSTWNTSIKRDQYEKQHHTFTGYEYAYTKKSRGTTDYNVETTDTLTINTDYLTEAESLWMEEFASSPSVYYELENELIAVNVNTNRIQRKTSLNDKLMQYTFEIEGSLINNRQRG